MSRLWEWFSGPEGDVRLHRGLLVAWIAITIVSIPTGWISSVVFVAVCSLYANIASHWAALSASKSEVEAAS